MLQIRGDNLLCYNAGQERAHSECCSSLSDFYLAKNVQLVRARGQLALRADTIGKRGPRKARPTRTCTPRTLSSAWRTRRTLTGLPATGSQPERGRFGSGRARCRGHMTLMKSKTVRRRAEHKCCSAAGSAGRNRFPRAPTAVAPSTPDFVCSPPLCKAPVRR